MAFFQNKPSLANLEIDFAHPLARGIAEVVLYNDGPNAPVELVTRRRGIHASGVTTRQGLYGREAKYTGTASTGHTDFGTFQPVTNNAGFTVMILADPIAESRGSTFWSQRSATAQIGLILNADGGAGALSGSLVLFQVGTAGTINAGSATGIITGGYAWYGASSTGNNGLTKYYKDGLLHTSLTNNNPGGTLVSSDQLFWVGCPAGNTGIGYAVSCATAGVFAWNRVLSDAEIREFVADPWDMFTPSAHHTDDAWIWSLAAPAAVLETQVNARSVINSNLSTQIQLASAPKGASYVSAALQGGALLEATLRANASIIAGASTQIQLQSVLRGLAYLNGDFTPQAAALTAQLNASSALRSTLTTQIPLSARPTGVASLLSSLGVVSAGAQLEGTIYLSAYLRGLLEEDSITWICIHGSTGVWNEIPIGDNSTDC